MRPKRTEPNVIDGPFPEAAVAPPEGLDELRRERIVYDGITNLPIHPFETPERADERIDHLGVIYLQVGKFFGFEELFGWEHYDRVLAGLSEGLQDDVRTSRLAPHVHSIRFSGADGFFILYEPAAGGPRPAGRQSRRGSGATACGRRPAARGRRSRERPPISSTSSSRASRRPTTRACGPRATSCARSRKPSRSSRSARPTRSSSSSRA